MRLKTITSILIPHTPKVVKLMFNILVDTCLAKGASIPSSLQHLVQSSSPQNNGKEYATRYYHVWKGL